MFSFISALIIFIFLGTGISLLLLSILFYKRDQNSLSRTFVVLMVFCAIWVFFNLFELIVSSTSGTLMWGRLKYFGIIGVPVAWVNFAFCYTGRRKYVNHRNTALLLVVPVIILFTLWTNGYHHLFYEEIVIKELEGLTYFSAEFGSFFWFNAMYIYLLVVAGIAIVLHALSNVHRKYWKQATVIGVGVLTPLFGNILYLSTFKSGFDITALLFLPTSISLALGIRNLNFLDTLLIGREKVFEKTSNALFVLDDTGKIIDLNKVGEELIEEIGLHNDVIGKRAEDVFFKKFSCTYNSNLNKESRREFEIEKNGEKNYFEALIDPLRGPKEKNIGWSVTIRNITERKEAEERERLLHSLLRHDVGNKAQIVQGFLELLKDTELSEKQRELVEKSICGSKEGIDIIEKVRMLREVSEEKEIKEVRLSTVIKNVIEEREAKARERGIEISYEESECKVRAGALLEELFSNLLENSIQHSKGNTIKISSQDKENGCIITIEDDGKGISDEIKEKAFEKDYNDTETGGSGLGLYLVKKIAENYSGNIEVKDSELGGARFDLYLKKP